MASAKGTYAWDTADRISDKIVAIINTELAAMRKANKIEPLQLLCGQLLAFKALVRTMPTTSILSIVNVLNVIDALLSELIKTGENRQ